MGMPSLWQEWQIDYQRRGLRWEDVTRDGPINPTHYAVTTPRIVFVLRETNDFGGGDLRELLADGPKYQMWHTLARWAAGLLGGFPDYDEIDRYTVMRKALHRVAAVNLKKITGGAGSWDAQIHAFTVVDRHLLTRQLRELEPSIVVACGTFPQVMWLLDLQVDPLEPFEQPVKAEDPATWVIPFRHPVRCDNRKSYSELQRLASRFGNQARFLNAG